MVKEKTWVSVKSQGGSENHGTEGNICLLLSSAVESLYPYLPKISIFSSLFLTTLTIFISFLKFLLSIVDYNVK